ncbi:E3 ubiquitin-protein ligase Midline-1-like [Glandiceps talaboti]
MASALQKELSCPICFELYSVPLLLPCGHTFCKECLKKYRATSRGSSTLTCPTCRQMVKLERGTLDTLVRNFMLDSIIDQYKDTQIRDGKKLSHREEVVWCMVCEAEPNKAEKSCTVCKLSYCSKCLATFHPNRR